MCFYDVLYDTEQYCTSRRKYFQQVQKLSKSKPTRYLGVRSGRVQRYEGEVFQQWSIERETPRPNNGPFRAPQASSEMGTRGASRRPTSRTLTPTPRFFRVLGVSRIQNEVFGSYKSKSSGQNATHTGWGLSKSKSPCSRDRTPYRPLAEQPQT